jgi:hypothetical protein
MTIILINTKRIALCIKLQVAAWWQNSLGVPDDSILKNMLISETSIYYSTQVQSVDQI